MDYIGPGMFKALIMPSFFFMLFFREKRREGNRGNVFRVLCRWTPVSVVPENVFSDLVNSKRCNEIKKLTQKQPFLLKVIAQPGTLSYKMS